MLCHCQFKAVVSTGQSNTSTVRGGVVHIPARDSASTVLGFDWPVETVIFRCFKKRSKKKNSKDNGTTRESIYSNVKPWFKLKKCEIIPQVSPSPSPVAITVDRE